MAQKNAQTLPHVRYADVDVYFEEAVNIEHHRPAMVVVWKKRKKALMRIIPSKKWDELIDTIQEQLNGLFSHETIHIWLHKVFAIRSSKDLDNLPRPTSWEEYMAGVFGWNLNNYDWKWREAERN